MEIIPAVTYTYLRTEKKFPNVWCAGCGIGIALGAIIRAIDNLKLDRNDVAMVSGIGCSSRMPVYVDFNTLHTTHGRALTFATGVKLANPKLQVIVVIGDGDATAIGGNHFIHAARTATSLYGHIEQPFSIAELAVTAGAAMVGRGTVYHATLLDQLMEAAI